MGLFEIALIAALGYLLFGAKKLPELSKSIGKTIRNFKEGLSEIDVDAKDIHDDPELVERQNKSKPKSKPQSDGKE